MAYLPWEPKGEATERWGASQMHLSWDTLHLIFFSCKMRVMAATLSRGLKPLKRAAAQNSVWSAAP
jgi:hypothetical protein